MESDGGGGNIQKLPEECVSQAIALTSPRDACRAEVVSAAFRAAAASDAVWKSFLPRDYAEILSRAVDRVEFDSMKRLFFRLCESILIDGGKMSFSLDRETGAKCFMLSARELSIVWADTPHYWTWNHHPGSRFSEVAELLNVCWLDIHGKIDSRMLSQRTNYTAYLIFKVSDQPKGLGYPFQEVSVTVGAHISNLSVRLHESEEAARPFRPIFRRPRFMMNFLRRANLHQGPPGEELRYPIDPPVDLIDGAQEAPQDQRPDVDEPPPQDGSQSEGKTVGVPQRRQDGWMEVLLGEFYNEEGDDGEIYMSLKEIKGGHWKSGLIVQGIEMRPKK